MTPNTFRPFVGPAAKSAEWYAIRKYDASRKGRPVVIGASSAAAACAQSEYSDPLAVYAEALGMVAPFEGNAATRMGNWQEEGILREWEFERGLKLERGLPMYFHPKHWFMGATPDGAVVDQECFKLVVDAKDTNGRMLDRTSEDATKYGEEGTDHVPIDIYFQGQQQCEVLGVDKVEFAAWFSDQKKLRIYPVERNDDLISCIVDAEKELVERIIRRDPPEPNWTHERTRKLIQEVNGLVPGKKTTLSDEMAAKWVESCRWADAEKEAKELKDALRNEVLFAMGDAQIGLMPNGTKKITRSVIAPQYITQAEIDKLAARLGEVKKRGHERMSESKVK